jgi:hypothetical protein
MKSRHTYEYPLTAEPERRVDPVREALAHAIARIAQKACRNGEAGSRQWPELQELPLLNSWLCVGEDYADAVMAEMMSAALKAKATPEAVMHVEYPSPAGGDGT